MDVAVLSRVLGNGQRVGETVRVLRCEPIWSQPGAVLDFFRLRLGTALQSLHLYDYLRRLTLHLSTSLPHDRTIPVAFPSLHELSLSSVLVDEAAISLILDGAAFPALKAFAYHDLEVRGRRDTIILPYLDWHRELEVVLVSDRLMPGSELLTVSQRLDSNVLLNMLPVPTVTSTYHRFAAKAYPPPGLMAQITDKHRAIAKVERACAERGVLLLWEEEDISSDPFASLVPPVFWRYMREKRARRAQMRGEL
ncbi:hypothetical protein JCM10207_004737 [Rhodosporidiobolus poonsookiae]